MDFQGKISKRAVLQFAGAFIAWVIGAGFATGQEVLQFFTSYGYRSYGVVLLNLAGFLLLGQILPLTGYEQKEQTPFNHFEYFCGKKAGAFYSWLIPVTLVLIMSVLLSGAGATLSEYYGIHRYIGSALMAGMVLCAYLAGFERLVKIVSAIGPVIILFSLLVGALTVLRDSPRFSEVLQAQPVLWESRAAPHWLLSAVLYLSLNFLSGSAYFTALGRWAEKRKEAKYGAILGAGAIVLSIAIMNTAILLNAEEAASFAIPVLFLARRLSYLLGAVFSIVLILGMFSSCSAMMWSVCSRLQKGGKKGNRIFAVLVTGLVFVLSLFSFSELVGIFYPLVGYAGLVFISCVLYKGIRRRP